MLKYLLKPVWWCICFFILTPIFVISATIFYLIITIWDYKAGLKLWKGSPFEYQVGDDWEIIRTYKTPWHYLLNKKPVIEKEGWILAYAKRKLGEK
jgi:hypothetical protein